MKPPARFFPKDMPVTLSNYQAAFLGPDGDPSLVEADREMVAFQDVMAQGRKIVQIPQALDFADFTSVEWDRMRREISVWTALLDDAYQTCVRNLPLGPRLFRVDGVSEYDPSEPSQAEEAADRLRELGE